MWGWPDVVAVQDAGKGEIMVIAFSGLTAHPNGYQSLRFHVQYNRKYKPAGFLAE